AEPDRPDFRTSAGLSDERIVARDSVSLSVLLVIDVDVDHFSQQQIHVLGIPVRITMWTGVAHGEVQVIIRPELKTDSSVVTSETWDRDQAARRFARIMTEIGSHLLLDDGCRNAVVFKNLIFEVIFSVLQKIGMERQTEKTIWPGLAVCFGDLIGKH